MKVTVFGLGLIGGSMALDLKASGRARHITGVERDPRHAAQALRLGLADEILPRKESLAGAQLVILAVPADELLKLLPLLLGMIEDGTVITDTGSTKSALCRSVTGHPRRRSYVAAHPMAGTEFSGPAAAQRELFRNKTVILCEKEKTDSAAFRMVHDMYTALGMRVTGMEADAHDEHAAYVSHISHISSFVLANTVLDIEKRRSDIFSMAGGGFASTVRLAASSAAMWTPVFRQNRDFVLRALDAYRKNLNDFRKAILHGDEATLNRLIRKANRIHEALVQPKQKEIQTLNHKPG